MVFSLYLFVVVVFLEIDLFLFVYVVLGFCKLRINEKLLYVWGEVVVWKGWGFGN